MHIDVAASRQPVEEDERDAGLSTPQRILRSSYRQRIAASRITPERREELRRIAHQSFEDRLRRAAGKMEIDWAGAGMDQDPAAGQLQFESEMSSTEDEPRRRKRKSDAVDGKVQCDSNASADEDGDRAMTDAPPVDKIEPVEPAKPRRRYGAKTASSLRKKASAFIEGSMRDRASQKPPKEFTEFSAIEIDYDENAPTPYPTPYQHSAPFEVPDEGAQKKKGFAFGMGSLFRFNPLRVLKEASSAWKRSKIMYDRDQEFKREDEQQARREKEYYEKQYQAMKAGGGFNFQYVKPDGTIGQAVSTDSAVVYDDPASNDDPHYLSGSARKRQRPELPGRLSSSTIRHVDDSDDEEQANSMKRLDVPAVVRQSPRAECVVTYAPPPPPEPLDSEEELREKRSPSFESIHKFVKKTSRTFTGSRSESSEDSQERPLTQREVKKQQRLINKVSSLEEQLAKTKKELEEVVNRSRVASTKIGRKSGEFKRRTTKTKKSMDSAIAVSSVEDSDAGEDCVPHDGSAKGLTMSEPVVWESQLMPPPPPRPGVYEIRPLSHRRSVSEGVTMGDSQKDSHIASDFSIRPSSASVHQMEGICEVSPEPALPNRRRSRSSLTSRLRSHSKDRRRSGGLESPPPPVGDSEAPPGVPKVPEVFGGQGTVTA